VDVYASNQPQWVNSNGGGAGGSDKFLYLFENDTCLYFRNSLQFDSLKAGERYQVCFEAATASSTGQAFVFGGLVSYQNGVNPIPDGEGRMKFTAPPGTVPEGWLPLPANPAWVNGQSTVIPWQQYCFEFVAPTVVDGVTYAVGQDLPEFVALEISIQSAFGVPSAAVVLDNISLKRLTVVPEPNSIALLGVAGGAAWFWRRRRAAA
jgi:hypothetical protein